MNLAWINKAASYTSPANVLKYGGAASLAIGIPAMAYSAAHARPGEALAEAGSVGIGIAMYPAMATLASGAAWLIPGVGPFGRLAAPLIGLALAHSPTEHLTKLAFRTIHQFSQVDRSIRRLECGGGYSQDSEMAAAARQRAIAEMSGSLIQARRYFGREAELMHQ